MPDDSLKGIAPIDISTLKTVIKQMYPIIRKAGLSLDIEWKQSLDSYLISLRKGPSKKYFLLNREDAIKCLEGEVCIYFGVWLLHVAGCKCHK